MWKKGLSIILIVAAIAFAVFLWFHLPDRVATQFGLDGQVTRTYPKLLAIGLPLGLTIVGSVLYFLSGERRNARAIAIAVIGLVAMVATLFFNR